MEESFAETPLLAHLIELKKRVIRIIFFFFIAFGLSYYFLAADVFKFLLEPLAQALGEEQRKMTYTLIEGFFTRLKISFFCALFISFPVIATQVYFFLAPGLYKKERRFLIPFLIASPVLFIAGAALFYYFIMPLAWQFLLGFEMMDGPVPVVYQDRISDYLRLVMQFMTGFGFSFQMPVVLMILARLGLVQVAWLKRNRRYAIVVIVIVAAIITPPDVFSQIGLAGILYALYEISILGCALVVKSREPATQLAAQEI